MDRLCEAMISIRQEIRDIEECKADPENYVLKNVPHTARHVSGTEWSHPYSREEAAYPLPYLLRSKYWSPIGRINDL